MIDFIDVSYRKIFLCRSSVVGNIINIIYIRKKLIMTCKKNEIRVINDLKLKEVSGGFFFLFMGAVFNVALIAGIASTQPKPRGS